MSKAKKPTLMQNLQITAAGLTPKDWLVEAVMADGLRLVHRSTGTSRTIKTAQ